MKLEDQVCNLELAKKLKKLGVKQDSLFYWGSNTGKNYMIIALSDKPNYPNVFNHTHSAFTVAELGEILPSGYYSIREGRVWECWLRTGKQKVEAKTEADARAKLVIYLLEINLTKQEG